MSNAETPSPVQKLIDLLARVPYRLQHLKCQIQRVEEKQDIIAQEVRCLKRKWDTIGADQDEIAWNQLSANQEMPQDRRVENPETEDSMDLAPTAELGDAWENDEG
eukprot:s708_g39.t1